jgi:hypothetical protein
VKTRKHIVNDQDYELRRFYVRCAFINVLSLPSCGDEKDFDDTNEMMSFEQHCSTSGVRNGSDAIAPQCGGGDGNDEKEVGCSLTESLRYCINVYLVAPFWWFCENLNAIFLEPFVS